MQIFIKTLTGRTLTIELEEGIDLNWLAIKHKILQKENISIDSQRLVFLGRLLNDHDRIDYDILRLEGTLHLITRLRPQFTLETHNLYAVVHNFYENIEEAQLQALQYAIPITGNEQPEQLKELFEKIYAVREERAKKNKTHIEQNRSDGTTAPKANSVVALVAVKNDGDLQAIDNGNGTQTIISRFDSQFLNYELFSYMLEDGISITSQLNRAGSRSSEQISNINQAFRLFCAHKKALDPQFLKHMQEEVRKNYGEVDAYIQFTADFLFEDKSPEEILKIISGVKNLCQGIKPDVNDPYYADIMQLDLIELAERFQLVKNKLIGKKEQERGIILDECKNAIRILLLNRLEEYEQQYSSTLKKQSSQVYTTKVPETSSRIIAIDHGGTLEVPLSALDHRGNIYPLQPAQDDLVLSRDQDNIPTVILSGQLILPKLKEITAQHPECLLAFHSKNKLEDQINLLKQMQEKIGVERMPHFSLIPVYDAEKYGTIRSDKPKIFYLDKNLVSTDVLPVEANIADYSIVIAWGADDLDAKVSVRKALEKGYDHYKTLKPSIGYLDKAKSWILDDGLTIPAKAKEEGWNSFLISASGPDAPRESLSLLQATISIESKFKREHEEQHTSIVQPQQEQKADSGRTQEQKITSLVEGEKNIGMFLTRLADLTDHLKKTAEKNPKYRKIASKSSSLYASLTLQCNLFFKQPSAAQLKIFAEECTKAIEIAHDEFKKHRGWHQINPILRGFLGIIAALTIIPGLVVALSAQHGFSGTFFVTPKTNSERQLDKLKTDFDKKSDSSLK